MADVAFTASELERAVALVGRHVPPTPSYAWPLLAAELGADVWVKHENHTPTGAFKVRGGLVYVDRLRRERPHVAGIVSATRGNHGQSLAVRRAAARPAGGDRRAPRQQPREERVDGRAGRRADRARRGLPGRSRARQGRGRRAGLRDGRVVPPRPRARRGDVRPRAVHGRAVDRDGLRARRDGVGHLRPDRRARPARRCRPRSSASSPRARRRRCSRSRPATS